MIQSKDEPSTYFHKRYRIKYCFGKWQIFHHTGKKVLAEVENLKQAKEFIELKEAKKVE